MTISIVSPALGAYVAGVSKPVGFILGAAMGVLLAALLVLSSGWRRRSKVRNAADLEDIAAVRAVFRGDEVAGVTGAVLASAAATVIVVSQDERARSDMASDLVHGLRGNGLDVACVSVLSEPMATRSLTRVDESTWTVGQEEAASVLAKSKRDRLGESTHSDVVVVDLPDLPAVELFLVGQADYLPILLVEAGETLDQILSRVDAVRAASPILVLNEASRRTSHA